MAYEFVSDLVTAFREDERDAVAPYFWSDCQLVRFINEALNDFCTKTLSVYDDQGIASVATYGAGDERVELHPSVLDVVRAWYPDSPRRYLNIVPIAAWGNGYRGGYWNAYTRCGDLAFEPGGYLRLSPKPVASGELRLMVIRKPLKGVGFSDRIPDLPQDHRRHLLLEVKRLAYRVADAEIFDPAKAINFAAEFESACQRVREESILRRGDCRRPIRGFW